MRAPKKYQTSSFIHFHIPSVHINAKVNGPMTDRVITADRYS